MCNILMQLCCHCFTYCFNRHDNSLQTHLITNANATTHHDTQQQCYTVHKISSFGKCKSNEDDADDINVNDNDTATNSSRLNTESISDYEEKEKGCRSLRTSPINKKKGHWGKALLKAKRDNVTDKSLQSLAGVSMMMLPTITVASSSATILVGNLVEKENSKDTLRRRRYGGTLHPTVTKTWLKSQSMLNVNCISDNENDNNNDNESELQDSKSSLIARKFGLDTSMYKSCRLSKSMEAVNKVWKYAEECTSSNKFIDFPYGTLHFTASYNKVNKKLFVRIEKIEGLAPKARDKQKYDCILKLSILPSEKHVKWSKVIAAHCSLNIDEGFVFTTKSATSKVLRLSVYDVQRQGKYESVGHALFYIEDALTNDNEARVMKLYKQSIINNNATMCNVHLTLSYDKRNELLNVTVTDVQNLPISTSTSTGKCKVYLKLLYYNYGKRVRQVFSPSIAPSDDRQHVSFNFKSDFKLLDEALDDAYLVLAVKVKGFLKKDIIAGRLILGPLLYAEYGQKLTPWGRALLTGQLVSHTFITYL